MKQGSARLAGAREFYKLFVSAATPYVKRRFALAVVIAVAVSLLAGVGPLALKWIVDSFDPVNAPRSQSVAWLVVAYVGVHWLNRVMGGMQAYLHAQADRRMYRALSDRLFDHVLRLPLRFHLERQTGAVGETLSNGLSGYQMVQQVLLFSIVPVLIQLVTVSVVLLTLKQETVLVLFLIAVAGYGAAFGYGATQARRAARQVSATQIEARALMTDSILNYETVKYFTAEAVIRERVDQSLMRSERDWIKYHAAYAWNTTRVATVFALFLGATMLYATTQVTTGKMTVGTFVLVNAYLLQLVAPVEMIGAATQTLSQGLSFLEKLLELFQVRAEPSCLARAVPLAGPGKLAFENVTVGYSAGRTTLSNVSFELPAGKTLGIVGASGAGKSTLVRLLTRMMEPDEGRILIDDVPITVPEIASVRAAIAVVPQDTVLFNDSIRYNIGFGRLGSTHDEIEDAARIAELHDFIMKLPEGYDTTVGERGVRLSGGERQRVSIARAALKGARIFVFDEATSSLDSRTESDILRNLRLLASRSTSVVIAHRLSTVVHADQIIVLHGGTVVEHGTHEALLRANGHYSGLWRAQQRHPELNSASNA